MQKIAGKEYLTIHIETGGSYEIEYDNEQYVDILNATDGYIKVSTDEITEDNYAVIPDGAAYNDIKITGGKLYVISESTGYISLVAR